MDKIDPDKLMRLREEMVQARGVATSLRQQAEEAERAAETANFHFMSYASYGEDIVNGTLQGRAGLAYAADDGLIGKYHSVGCACADCHAKGKPYGGGY